MVKSGYKRLNFVPLKILYKSVLGRTMVARGAFVSAKIRPFMSIFSHTKEHKLSLSYSHFVRIFWGLISANASSDIRDLWTLSYWTKISYADMLLSLNDDEKICSTKRFTYTANTFFHNMPFSPCWQRNDSRSALKPSYYRKYFYVWNSYALIKILACCDWWPTCLHGRRMAKPPELRCSRTE